MHAWSELRTLTSAFGGRTASLEPEAWRGVVAMFPSD